MPLRTHRYARTATAALLSLVLGFSTLLGSVHPSKPLVAHSGPGWRLVASYSVLEALASPTPSPAPTASPEPPPTPSPSPSPTPEPTPEPAPQGVPDRIRAEWRRQGLSNTEWAVSTVDCETGGTFDPTIHNPSGKYHGLWQADMNFARSYGTGQDPHTMSVEGQTAMAANGYKARGSSPWPTCGR